MMKLLLARALVGSGITGTGVRHSISGVGIAMLANQGVDEPTAQTIVEGIVALSGLVLSRFRR